jgi:NodT family efflux transporter outer membrane factor (OMF) lipoprotein
MKILRRLLMALAPVFAAACTVGPNYVKPALPAPPAYSEAANTPRTAVLQTQADLSTWWTQFGDPELNSLIQRALQDNPDLQSAASRVREARQQERVAFAAELPSVSGTGNALTLNSNRKTSSATTSAAGSSGAAGAASGASGFQIPSHANLFAAGFDATWELDLFGGTRRGIEAARADTEAAEWARRDGQVSLMAEVANDYLTLRTLQARIGIGEQELKRQQGLFKLIDARRKTGFLTGLDTNQQSEQVAVAAAMIPQLDAEARAMIHALGVLIGQPPETLTQALKASDNVTLPPPPPTLPVGLPSELLERRPDIREAERRLASANAQIGVQEANLYPKVNLIGLASFASPSISNLFSADNFASAAAGLVSEKIFDGGKTRAQIRAAEEERRQAYLAYRSAVLSAFQNVEDALSRLTSEETRRARLAESVTAASNSLAIAQAQYRTGVVPFINVLQSENALLNSRDQLTQSDSQALTDVVAVYKALGGGWSPLNGPKHPEPR